MKRAFFSSIAVALLLCVSPGFAAQNSRQTVGAAGYNPAVDYPGDYKANLIFVKRSGSSAWLRAVKLDRLSRVTCQDALDQLQRHGTWKGHLNDDGSCASYDEPAEWALGNWLNYQDSMGPGSR